MIKRVGTILLVLLIFSACKKQEELEILPESNDPVFTLTGSIDNQQMTYLAGNNGMVMRNGVEARNGISYFYSELGNTDRKFRIGLYDGHVAIPDFQATLKSGDTLFLAKKFAEPLALLSKKYLTNAAQIERIDWYVDNAFVGQDEVELLEAGKFNVCGHFTFKNGSQQTICNQMLLGFEQEVDFTIRHFMNEVGSVNLWMDGNLSEISTVEWYNDGQLVSTAKSLTMNVGFSQSIITCKIKTIAGAERVKRILVDGKVSGNYIEDFDILLRETIQTKWDFGVGLEIYQNGSWYSSFEVENYKSFLFISKVEYYGVNSQNKPIYKVTSNIDAKLKNASSGQAITAKLQTVFAYILQD
jgi:hypothetical protein